MQKNCFPQTKSSCEFLKSYLWLLDFSLNGENASPHQISLLFLYFYSVSSLIFFFAYYSHQHHWLPFLLVYSCYFSRSHSPSPLLLLRGLPVPLLPSLPEPLHLWVTPPWRSLELSEGFCLGSNLGAGA